MKDKNDASGRKKQIQVFIILFIVFIVFVILVTLFSGNSNNNDSSNNENTSSTSTTGETSTIDSTTVTGLLGENNTMIPATIESVVSNTVLKVNKNGESIEVALIGISVSEDVSNNELQRLNELMPSGTQVYLLYDESTYNESGQDLCYVWLTNDTDIYYSPNVGDYMLQGILIKEGLAEPKPEYPNSRYERAFELLNL